MNKDPVSDTSKQKLDTSLERKAPAVVDDVEAARARSRQDEVAPADKGVGVHDIARVQAERNTRNGRE